MVAKRKIKTEPQSASPALVPGATPWDLQRAPRIAVAKPRLAPLEAALPYLRRIDAARIYSNYGPLNTLFEQKLAERFGLADGSIVTCCNGTAGLTLALQAAAGRFGGYCIMPSWTFAATAHAAIAAGLTPFLADVDAETGALTPQIAKRAILAAPGRVAAVLPVAPFGLPIDLSAWDAFTDKTGVGAVLDAAAGFDALTPARTPAVVSLHATKILGIGEGGFIASTDTDKIADIRRRANFGFDGQRDASLAGGNGKLSEFGAAYGLAALDLWPLQRVEYQTVAAYYRAAFEGDPRVRLAPGTGEDWVCSTFNIEAAPAAIAAIETRLMEAGIATRRWWGKGLHGHRAFKDLPRTALRTTERLAASTLGLPCWPGLSTAEIDEVVAVVKVLSPT